MGDTMTHDVPDPLVEFQLFETGACARVGSLGGGWGAWEEVGRLQISVGGGCHGAQRAQPSDASLTALPRPLHSASASCSGRTPIPPPLRSKFVVIERQREDEAAMGEQALETVLAPVPVPPVSYRRKVVPVLQVDSEGGRPPWGCRL